ncbi:MAG: hypothetical protein EOO88_40660 [Pedobacter sp.]|nr:MAG: hypothetical protein EOO88_40660 [Pedobacter sp.]
METLSLIQTAIFFAGLAQIVLVGGSLLIPGILNWTNELAKVQILIKQMFWTYAAYILVINLCFGLLSVFALAELLNGSLMSMLVCGFIAMYWVSRVGVQFFYFDRSGFPTGVWHRIAETVLIILFVFLSIVYSMACYYNYQQL